MEKIFHIKLCWNEITPTNNNRCIANNNSNIFCFHKSEKRHSNCRLIRGPLYCKFNSFAGRKYCANEFSICICINLGLNEGARHSWWVIGNRLNGGTPTNKRFFFVHSSLTSVNCRLHFCLHLHYLGSWFRDCVFLITFVFHLTTHYTRCSLPKCISHNQLDASDLMNFFFIFFFIVVAVYDLCFSSLPFDSRFFSCFVSFIE